MEIFSKRGVSTEGVTELLLAWRGGDDSALERLIPLVYADLRRLARRHLQQERPDHTLQATALVNEVYLRLVRSSRVQWRDRAHFFAVAAQLMRRVLVDAARRRRFQKRGGGTVMVAFDLRGLAAPERPVDLVALDEALEKLAEGAPRKAKVIELRYFGGMTIDETAAALDVSIDVVKQEWRTARLWLANALGGTDRGLEPH